MAGNSDKGAIRLYGALRGYLGHNPEDKQLIAAFEADPEGGSQALATRLRDLLRDDPALAEQLLAALGEDADAQFVNMVTGGHVDQIVNVARVGVLNLTVKRYLSIFKDVMQLVVFLTALVIVGSVGGYLVWHSQQPARMHGGFNIAVAQFGEVDNDGKLRVTGDSAKMSRALANYLDSAYSSSDFGLTVEISHEHMPLVEEDLQAQKLAQNVNADLVIYGTLLGGEQVATLLPRFWIDPDPNIAELSGQNSLEAPIRFVPTKLAESGYLTETLRSNAGVLVLFTKALVSLKGDKLDAAASSLDQALLEAKADFRGKEILYLLGATIARLQGNYDMALEHAASALTLNPEYARAYLAVGNIYYRQVAEDGNWTREDLLDEAARWYSSALQASDAAPSAYIAEKANVSLGNVYVVEAQRYDDPMLFQQAIDHYTTVVKRYEANRDPSYRENVRGLVAIAYLGLGAVYQRQGDLFTAENYYRQCSDMTADTKIRQQCSELLEGIAASG